MKKIFLSTTLFFFAGIAFAQILEPIKWQFSEKKTDSTELELQITAKIDAGWHLYGMDLPDGGPIPTTFHFELSNAELDGKIEPSSPPVDKFDDTFGLQLSWWNTEAHFLQRFKIKDNYSIKGYVEFMGCNDGTCLPPSKIEFSFGTPAIPINAFTPLNIQSEKKPNDYWEPVIEELRSFGETEGENSAEPLWVIFLKGFLGGLLALLTPCVWPIIPMTVSFFLKRKGKGKRDAILYGVSIIFIYLFLGILITLLFGASALNSLSTNAFFNLFFFALLVLFAISFFGAFELTLPSSWTTKLDAKAEKTTGILSILLMAFTLVLVSFSCTGPIIGTLLVDVSVNGTLLSPAVGMFGFALTLAMPFSIFAMFPSWLKKLPKSGGWLNSVKVVLGFLELAFALKFFSVADLAYGWHLLDRETFIVLWIVIFTMLGFYLLGKIKFAHDSELPHVSVPRLLLAMVSFAYAIYLIPGLWGAPLKSTSAFAPPLYTQDFNLYNNEVHANFQDYDEGMNYAKQKGLPILIDFSGFGCVNCRKMESSVWTDSKVSDLLHSKFVLITLFVDDKTLLKEPLNIVENGTERTLKTIGDKNSYLQRHKFGANAQPFYVMLNNDGMPIANSYAFDTNVGNFINYLQNGLKNY